MRLALFAVVSVAVIACGWIWLRPVAPIDTPSFRLQPMKSERHELTVRGVTTPPVPRIEFVMPSGVRVQGVVQ